MLFTRPLYLLFPELMGKSLIQILDAALASAVERSGEHLACRSGCSQCCYGVFEISGLDAARLREGLKVAAVEVRERVLARVEAARGKLGPFYPGDLGTGVLTGSEDEVELFEEWAHAEACPVLDPGTQTCDLYAHRPVLCRTFGPPIANDAEDPEAGLAICELCFTEATDEEIAAAAMDSGFRGEQERMEREFESAHEHGGATFVAFAFLPVPCAERELG
jgi:Fe-S-cluster containining protein